MLGLPIGKFAFELQCAPRITASRRPTINVCHVAMADLWAGAEAQLAILLRSLARVPDLRMSAILFNDGRLANESRDVRINTHLIPGAGRTALSIVKELLDRRSPHSQI